MTIEHRITIEPTTEQELEARLEQLHRPHALIKAARAAGGRLAGLWGGYTQVILNPEHFGLQAPPADDEQPRLKLPRIKATGVELPLEDRTLTPLEFVDPFCKTPAKKKKFLEAATSKPQLQRFTVVETGEGWRYRAIGGGLSTLRAQQDALARAGVVSGDELFRIVEVLALDEETIDRVPAEESDKWPWAVNPELRPDGSLNVGWHNCRLDGHERGRLLEQRAEDLRVKRRRRDRVIRQMQREPIT